MQSLQRFYFSFPGNSLSRALIPPPRSCDHVATWNIMLNIKGILQSIFLELKALENAFGGVSSKVAITNILHGGHDGSYVQAPCPQEASDASSTWLAFPEVGLGLALLQLLLGAKATGRASLDGLL